MAVKQEKFQEKQLERSAPVSLPSAEMDCEKKGAWIDERSFSLLLQEYRLSLLHLHFGLTRVPLARARLGDDYAPTSWAKQSPLLPSV